MKRYGNLYPMICDPENIRVAHENARKGKRHYPSVAKVDTDQEHYLAELRGILEQERFTTSPYNVFLKRGRKDRLIYKLPYYPDRIVHHCIVQVLEPIWHKCYIRDTYSSLKGRGIQDGADRMRLFLRDAPGTAYCLKMDVAKFYPSVDRDILRELLARKIKCARTMRLLCGIIESGDAGVPIGNYLSQHFGNLYLTGYDHWMKEEQKARYYSRYCDDIVVLGEDKGRLHELRRCTEQYMRERLRLRIKPNWRVFPVDAGGVDYLGYVFRHDHVRLRKSIAQDFKRKTVQIKKHYIRMPLPKIINALMSYHGWLSHADGWNLWRRHVDAEITGIVKTVCMSNGQTIPKPLRKVPT